MCRLPIISRLLDSRDASLKAGATKPPPVAAVVATGVGRSQPTLSRRF